jgi:hypothetical protein
MSGSFRTPVWQALWSNTAGPSAPVHVIWQAPTRGYRRMVDGPSRAQSFFKETAMHPAVGYPQSPSGQNNQFCVPLRTSGKRFEAARCDYGRKPDVS